MRWCEFVSLRIGTSVGVLSAQERTFAFRKIQVGDLTAGGIVGFSKSNLLHGVGRSVYRLVGLSVGWLVGRSVSQTFIHSIS